MSQAITFPCPQCGAGFHLTADYLARYGGQTTTCTSCGTPFQLPPATALTSAPTSVLPSMPPQAPGPVPVLPYRAASVGQASGVWQEGKTLVALNGARLPDQCVKCNAPADGPLRRKTFYWHHPAVYIAVISPLIYIILALALRKSGTVQLGLCQKHRSRRLLGIWGGIGTALLSILAFVVAGQYDMPGLIAVGLLLIVGGLIWSLLSARTLTPTKIDDRFLWLRGAHPSLLESLPPVPTPGGYAPQYGYAPPGG